MREKDRKTWTAALEQLADAGHPLEGLVNDILVPPFRKLTEIVTPDVQRVGTSDRVRPDAPLAVSALLTGRSRSPSLVGCIPQRLAPFTPPHLDD